MNQHMAQIEKFKYREKPTSEKMNKMVDAINLLFTSGALNPTFSLEGNKLYVSFPEIPTTV